MNEPHDDEKKLERIVGAAVEAVVESSEEEIEAEIRASGLDPDVVAGEVQDLLRGAVEKHRGQERLRRSRIEYEARITKRSADEISLPSTPQARRQLLAQVFRAQPQTAGMLTMQFRDLEDLPDEDVASCLRQLAELGALADLSSG